ncbi:DUF4158 domain-containing protein [Streptomyces sp. HC307]|uniref:DUF4158 domain-containing protein n=1 Tax=Streptomyces flavusporus TaxID=3385496 RepID=UPI00391735B2
MPDGGQLAGYFMLDRDARRRATACRGERSQLGYGIQLGTVRFLDTFLDNPEDAPAEVVEYVADQLGQSPSVLAGYGAERTRWAHKTAIKDACGYTERSDPPQPPPLVRGRRHRLHPGLVQRAHQRAPQLLQQTHPQRGGQRPTADRSAPHPSAGTPPAGHSPHPRGTANSQPSPDVKPCDTKLHSLRRSYSTPYSSLGWRHEADVLIARGPVVPSNR